MKTFKQHLKEVTLPGRYAFHETHIDAAFSIFKDKRICSMKQLAGDDEMLGPEGDYVSTTFMKEPEDTEMYYGVSDNQCMFVIDVSDLQGKYEPEYEGGLFSIASCAVFADEMSRGDIGKGGEEAFY